MPTKKFPENELDIQDARRPKTKLITYLRNGKEFTALAITRGDSYYVPQEGTHKGQQIHKMNLIPEKGVQNGI